MSERRVSDLVKRLRERRLDYVDSHTGLRVPDAGGEDKDCAEAADEIERLTRERDEASKLAGTMDELHARGQLAYAALASQVVALRDSHIVKFSDGSRGCHGCGMRWEGMVAEVHAAGCVVNDTATAARETERRLEERGALKALRAAITQCKLDSIEWLEAANRLLSLKDKFEAKNKEWQGCMDRQAEALRIAALIVALSPAEVVKETPDATSE